MATDNIRFKADTSAFRKAMDGAKLSILRFTHSMLHMSALNGEFGYWGKQLVKLERSKRRGTITPRQEARLSMARANCLAIQREKTRRQSRFFDRLVDGALHGHAWVASPVRHAGGPYFDPQTLELTASRMRERIGDRANTNGFDPMHFHPTDSIKRLRELGISRPRQFIPADPVTLENVRAALKGIKYTKPPQFNPQEKIVNHASWFDEIPTPLTPEELALISGLNVGTSMGYTIPEPTPELNPPGLTMWAQQRFIPQIMRPGPVFSIDVPPIEPAEVYLADPLIDAFGDHETELAAFIVCKYFQSVGDWGTFNRRMMHEFFERYSVPVGDSHEFLYEKLIAGGWIIEDENGVMKVTRDFISRCYRTGLDNLKRGIEKEKESAVDAPNSEQVS